MPSLDRRKLLQSGIALALPLGGFSVLSGCQESTGDSSSKTPEVTDSKNSTNEKTETQNESKMMQIKYLEIVTPDVDALCKQYSAMHGVTFGEPEANLGNARTAKIEGDGLIGIRAPMRESETPVIRPYIHVDNVEEAVAAAKEAGAEIAIPKMEIPGFATIAIVIQGGIECGLWQEP